MFDLPTKTKIEQRRANSFRNNLLNLGFMRMQFSVYIKHVANLEECEKLAKKVSYILENEGQVSVIFITDRQFALTKTYFGTTKKKNLQTEHEEYKQLLLF